MSADDQTFRILTELDLSEYETRAYLSVLEGGVMVARDISDRASIPYAKVYQTLNELIEKQLIVGDEGRPKKFRARAPRDAIMDRLEFMEKTWKEKHRQRRSHLEQLLPELEGLFQSSDVSIEEEQGVWNISGSTNISSRLIKLINRTSKTILIITGDYPVLQDNFLKLFKDTTPAVLTLITNKKIKAQQFAEVYVCEKVGSALTIIFDSFAMISIAEIQRGKYSSGEFTAVLTQIRELVESALTNYEVMMA